MNMLFELVGLTFRLWMKAYLYITLGIIISISLLFFKDLVYEPESLLLIGGWLIFLFLFDFKLALAFLLPPVCFFISMLIARNKLAGVWLNYKGSTLRLWFFLTIGFLIILRVYVDEGWNIGRFSCNRLAWFTVLYACYSLLIITFLRKLRHSKKVVTKEFQFKLLMMFLPVMLVNPINIIAWIGIVVISWYRLIPAERLKSFIISEFIVSILLIGLGGLIFHDEGFETPEMIVSPGQLFVVIWIIIMTVLNIFILRRLKIRRNDE